MTLQILWGALLAAVPIYWLVKLLSARNGSVEQGPMMAVVLGAVGLSMFAAAAVMFQLFVAPVVRRAKAALRAAQITEQPLVLLQQFQVGMIVVLALIESATIFGLVHAFITTAPPQIFELLAVLSMAGMVVFRVMVMGPFLASVRQLAQRMPA